jgi:hypothetical protein
MNPAESRSRERQIFMEILDSRLREERAKMRVQLKLPFVKGDDIKC